jgi:hypothetical protein
MSDIVDAIARIGVEFRRLDLDVPQAIILKDHDQGVRLLCQLHQRNNLMIPFGSGLGGKPIEHPDGSVWMEVEVYGIRVRWPAVKFAKREGGYVWT